MTESNAWLAGAIAFLAFLSFIYGCLVLLSPSPIITRPSERKYRSRKSPKVPIDLPDLKTSPGTIDLSVIIPAFNEVPRLPSMLKTTFDHLSKPEYTKRTCEFIIVDDGSTDGTTDFALELAQKYQQWDIRVVKLEANLGKGGAVRHGMLHARGRRLLMVDADGASRFEDLELLWNKMDELTVDGKPAVVIGSRAHLIKTEAVVKRSVLRNMAMYALHLTLRIVGVGHIRDTQCGFKLFTRDAAVAIFPFQHLKGWIFDVELLLLAKQIGIPVEEVSITWTEVPESKLRLLRDSILMFRDLLVLRANQLLGRWKAPAKIKVD